MICFIALFNVVVVIQCTVYIHSMIIYVGLGCLKAVRTLYMKNIYVYLFANLDSV